ncbi:MAG TPA: PP2C family serine/threonine-protein phosphatase [Blastocatellia bacterium]|nr:PP2C family serine/threonine-protein phosphatase [Blastocatellia bacterium]
MPDESAFNIAVYAKSDVGIVRPGNEDNFLVLNLSTADTWTPETIQGEPPPTLTTFNQSHYGSVLAVTDGMGGALAGEVASRLAVECVRDRLLELQASPVYSKFPFHERLRLAIELSNLYINQMSLKRAEFAGMGATFTAVGLFNTTAYFAQVGDSRAYVIRQGRAQLVTRDQSLVGQLVQAGHITEEEAERHTYKNVILQALGASQEINVVIDRLTLRDLDILVMCSDGLSNKVRTEEITEIVDKAPTLKEACEWLIKTANDRGGEDNITVLVAQFTGGKLQPLQDGDSTPRLLHSTAPLSGGTAPLKASDGDRWGAETVPRDPNLPYEIDLALIDDEEDTIRPDRDTGQPTEKLDREA